MDAQLSHSMTFLSMDMAGSTRVECSTDKNATDSLGRWGEVISGINHMCTRNGSFAEKS